MRRSQRKAVVSPAPSVCHAAGSSASSPPRSPNPETLQSPPCPAQRHGALHLPSACQTEKAAHGSGRRFHGMCSMLIPPTCRRSRGCDTAILQAVPLHAAGPLHGRVITQLPPRGSEPVAVAVVGRQTPPGSHGIAPGLSHQKPTDQQCAPTSHSKRKGNNPQTQKQHSRRRRNKRETD